MLDPRIAAQLVDRAALRPDVPESELASDEVAAALGPLLDSTLLAPDLPSRLSSPPGAPPEDVPNDGFIAAAGPGPAGSPDIAAALHAAAILLPSASPGPTLRGPEPRFDASSDSREIDALLRTTATPESGWPSLGPASRDVLMGPAVGPQADPAATTLRAIPGSGDLAWTQGPSLIEPGGFLPATDPRPGGPGHGASSLSEPGWTSLMPPSIPEGRLPDLSAPADWTSARASGDSEGDLGGESLAGLAPRLIQAAERLEAAAGQLTRQADHLPSPAPRPFRGRAAE